jgi:hypothetical protein
MISRELGRLSASSAAISIDKRERFARFIDPLRRAFVWLGLFNSENQISRELGRLLITARLRILQREFGPSCDLEGEGSQPNNRAYCVSSLPRAPNFSYVVKRGPRTPCHEPIVDREVHSDRESSRDNDCCHRKRLLNYRGPASPTQ